MTKDGTALGLTKENGKPSATLVATKEGAGMILYDKPRVGLSAADFAPGMILFDEDGEISERVP